MCIGVTGWLSRIDHKKQFRLEPYQNSELISQYPQINPEDCRNELHIISESGEILKGADAILEIWNKAEHWSSFMAFIFRLRPFIWIARPLYRLVARNRRWIYN